MAHALLQTNDQTTRALPGSVAERSAHTAGSAAHDARSTWPGDAALGVALGRDYARHGLVPPPEHLGNDHPVRQGWEAARPLFVQRPMAATPEASLLLQTRLKAWLRGQAVETLTLTPNFLRQIRVSHCPVTRAALSLPGAAPSCAQPLSSVRPGGAALQRRADDRRTPDTPRREAAVLARLRPDAAFAAGHVALMSPLADAAQGDLDLDEVLDTLRERQIAERRADAVALAPREAAPAAERDTRSALARLDRAQLGRLAVLRSFVTPLPHAQAAALPLLALPPNRLRLLNPVQALQAALTLQLSRSGWSKRLPQLEALLPAVGVKSAHAGPALRSFFYLLMSSCIAAGRPGRRPADQQAWRWVLEDAWQQPRVQFAWERFARLIDATQAQALLTRAAEAGLCAQQVRELTPEQATDGWALPTAGDLAVDAGATVESNESAPRFDGIRPFGSPQHLPAGEAARGSLNTSGRPMGSGLVRRAWRSRAAVPGQGPRPGSAAQTPAPGPTEQLPLPI